MVGVSVAVGISGSGVSVGASVGVSVSGGQVIGAVGDTALIECEEEAHLHFELTVNGEFTDPTEYMEMVSINEVYED